MDIIRLRLSFNDRHILKKSQRSDGLKRNWLQLKPSHHAISDFSSHILHTFNLHHSCPDGIILTMDGFVLPPFESTSILKDNDVIGVKRKGNLLSEFIQVDNAENLIHDDEIVGKQALLTGIPLLANGELEKESGDIQSKSDEQEEDDKDNNNSENNLYEEISPDRKRVSKKRKASKKPGSSKKKKRRHMDVQDSKDEFQADQNESNGFHPGKSSDTKKEVFEMKKKYRRASAIVSVESNGDISQPPPSGKRLSPIQENDIECDASVQEPDGAEKKPSRNARRKKAKRHWKSEVVKAEKGLLLLSDNTCCKAGTCIMQFKKMQSPEVDVNKHSVKLQQQIESREADDEISPDTKVVPIVIRPGHIRFEPLEEEEDGEALQQRHVSKEIIQWNGITSKKGQKWEKENSTLWRDESEGSKKERYEMMEIEEVKPSNYPIDFDKLAPLSRSPREGDLIAYRLVELSSTWTPELTSYRVGKTSWYDSVSHRILLTPLPEYPIVIEKLNKEDAFAQPPDNSFYKEDGSLEIEFSSLVEVRIVKESDSDPTQTASDQAHVPLMRNGATSSTATPNGNSNPHSEKQKNVWDEINETLNAKKAELMRENGWMKENSAWSFRAMRRSALGPTMAMLRANNEI